MLKRGGNQSLLERGNPPNPVNGRPLVTGVAPSLAFVATPPEAVVRE